MEANARRDHGPGGDSIGTSYDRLAARTTTLQQDADEEDEIVEQDLECAFGKLTCLVYCGHRQCLCAPSPAPVAMLNRV